MEPYNLSRKIAIQIDRLINIETVRQCRIIL